MGSWARCSTGEGRNRRSLHFATPDFLLRLVAPASFMRLSLTKATYVELVSFASLEIRVRSGRDDKSGGGPSLQDFLVPAEVSS